MVGCPDVPVSAFASPYRDHTGKLMRVCLITGGKIVTARLK